MKTVDPNLLEILRDSERNVIKRVAVKLEKENKNSYSGHTDFHSDGPTHVDSPMVD